MVVTWASSNWPRPKTKPSAKHTGQGNVSCIANRMVGVVQSETASKSELLPGQRRKQRLHAQQVVGKLRGGIER
jgi:hypothetical protein